MKSKEKFWKEGEDELREQLKRRDKREKIDIDQVGYNDYDPQKGGSNWYEDITEEGVDNI